MSKIAASIHDLLKQAPETAVQYARECERLLDKHFEEGFARKNPCVLAACIRASATDFGTAVLARAVEDQTAAIISAVGDIIEAG